MISIIQFDAASYLDSEEAIAEYIVAAREDGSQEMLQIAEHDIARARVMAQTHKPTPEKP